MKVDSFEPMYTISDRSAMLLAEICMIVGSNSSNRKVAMPNVVLDNVVRTIHSTLAIENNTLSIDQVTDLVNGKRIIGPKRDIAEVRNAIVAYGMFDAVDPYDIVDLLKVHAAMMDGLVENPGILRSCDVGVFSGTECIYQAPDYEDVPRLMEQLFGWLNREGIHPLIKSCVFHYEFEHIHPFEDGNGRMGRYWQSLILSKWEPLFSSLPVENLIFDRRTTYYAAINECNDADDCGHFIEYMLLAIRDTLLDFLTDQVTDQVTDQDKRIDKVMKCLESGPLSINQMMESIGVKHKPNFRENYLQPAIDRGLIEMTDPSHPNNRNQRYRIVAGRS